MKDEMPLDDTDIKELDVNPEKMARLRVILKPKPRRNQH